VQTKPEIHPSRNLVRGIATAAATAAVLIPAAGSIAGAAQTAAEGTDARAGQVELIDKRGTTIGSALDVAELRVDYADELEQAKKLDAEPADPVNPETLTAPQLERELDDLSDRVRKAERAAETEAAAPKVGTPESVGVSMATLEAIAACESGGDPTVIDSSGTYHGKYQFDLGTWASVGGSGAPSAAPEAEQDYRAALLYAQAGSSPWPVCGV
jgi:hypothetical protein